MPANKTSSKGKKTSTPKKKASARQNAAERISRETRVGQRSLPRGNKRVSQQRFPGETPLTGEDRPSGAAGGKQQGYRQDAYPQPGTRTDASPDPRAPTVKRRPRQSR